MTDELLDRYGELPRAASNLLLVALIRSLAERCDITQLRQDGADVHIGAPELDVEVWMELSSRYPGRLRMMVSANPYIRYRVAKGPHALEELRDLLSAYLEIAAKKTVDK